MHLRRCNLQLGALGAGTAAAGVSHLGQWGSDEDEVCAKWSQS